MANGNSFTINAPNNSKDNFYINSAQLNDSEYSKTYLSFDDLQKGGSLYFDMKDTPNTTWGSSKEAVPYSLSLDQKF